MAWYETFFDEHYLKEYARGLTPERAQREVDFINSTLSLPQIAPSATGSARILDLCCGHGRHTIELAAAGYSMVGQDLSVAFLGLAKGAAAARDLQIQFVHADMREIPFEGEFDAIINMFSAFGYFDDDAENQKVLDGVARALKPGVSSSSISSTPRGLFAIFSLKAGTSFQMEHLFSLYEITIS